MLDAAEHDRLVERRADLNARIANLRPHAFRRLELEARIAELTRRLLEIELTPAAPPVTPAVPEVPEDENHQLRYFQK